MPCHSPTKARVIFSLTRAVPSAAMEMVSLKSATRQLRTWAEAYSATMRRKNRTSSRRFVYAPRNIVRPSTLWRIQSCFDHRQLPSCAWPGRGKAPSPHELELHSDWFAIGGSRFEELLLLEAEHPGQNVGRERLNLGVQVAHDGVVVAARVLNCVLDRAERILELGEFLRGLELGIIFCHRKQTFEGAGQLILGGSLVDWAGGLHGHGAEFRDVLERTLFVGGVTFDGFDQIRNQVVAAFELNIDVGPGRFGAHAQLHQAVV